MRTEIRHRIAKKQKDTTNLLIDTLVSNRDLPFVEADRDLLLKHLTLERLIELVSWRPGDEVVTSPDDGDDSKPTTDKGPSGYAKGLAERKRRH
jgi:hypothetical protein